MVPFLCLLLLQTAFSGRIGQSRPWMRSQDTPEQRAQALLAQMTEDEKITMIHGVYGTYVGNVPENTRLGIPALNLNDGPQGFRDDAHPGTTTQWPSALTISQSWDPNMLFQFGSAMGAEFVGKGANVQLGPGMNVARVPVCGRNFEYLSGEDPYLGTIAVAQVIQGIQSQHVIANAKHYINNNQETNRDLVSADVDERTRIELYAPPFWASVDAGVLSVMCSYNRINSVYSCQNEETLTTELKGYAGFEYWVMSDWFATHSTVNSSNNGLDQEMPVPVYYNEPEIKNALSAGTIVQATIDDKVYRILVAMFTIGLFDIPQPTGSITNDVTSDAHNTLARTLAANGIVLLQNKNNILPLKKSIAKIGVFGAPANSSVITGGGGSGHVTPKYIVSPLQGIQNALASGTANITYCDGTNQATCVNLAKEVEIAVCVMATTSSEGTDRPNLQLPSDQTALCSAVGQANPNTVAVTINPGAILTPPWDNDVSAILAMGMPGQEEGNALADVLFGDVNPGGRLPVTFPNKDNEVGFTEDQYPGIDLHANYSEKLEIGYRWYAAHNVVPRFPFGHGLSYTTFSYSTLNVTGRTISFTVKNSGNVAGSEVPQLYIGFPASAGEPPIQLKRYSKLVLNPGSSQVVTWSLNDRDVSIWNVTTHSWTIVSGSYQVSVGASSQDFRLKGTMTV